jgi:hypothetical protein
MGTSAAPTNGSDEGFSTCKSELRFSESTNGPFPFSFIDNYDISEQTLFFQFQNIVPWPSRSIVGFFII